MYYLGHIGYWHFPLTVEKNQSSPVQSLSQMELIFYDIVSRMVLFQIHIFFVAYIII
jgi:hypothetical protein